jgi:hypothetical protein
MMAHRFEWLVKKRKSHVPFFSPFVHHSDPN